MRIVHLTTMIVLTTTGASLMHPVAADPVKQNAPSSTRHSPAQLWALACAGLLTEVNGQQHDVLWCYNPPAHIQKWKKALSEWWNVNSRTDLFETLDWIDKGGHRQEWNDYQSAIVFGDIEGLKKKCDDDDAEIARRLAIVRKYGTAVGSKSLLGWDYCRAIALCRWGTLCGYMTQDEAWHKIIPIARRLQNTFSSWSDLGKNYLIGREFWSADETQRIGAGYETRYEKLLTDKSSPWVVFPWKQPLDKDCYQIVK